MPPTPKTVTIAVLARVSGKRIWLQALAKLARYRRVGGATGRRVMSASGFRALFSTNRAG